MPSALIAHPSADVYGSDRQLLESIGGMREAGWDVTLCLPSPGPLVDLVVDADVQVFPFPVLRKALLGLLPLLRFAVRTPLDLVRLTSRVRRSRPDVVYVNTMTIPLWIIAARLARRPVLVHVHEAEADAPKLLRVALNAPLLLATTIVVNSSASARSITDVLPRLARRIRVVWNGVPDGGAAPAEAMLPGQLAFVGRLSPRKGVDVALEALAMLRAADRDVRLDVCGTAFEGYEWYEEALRRRATEPDIAGAVAFAGYVHPTERVLASASVVLVPSRVEPFGNTAVEAMLAQRPVVASRVQGLAEIVEDGRTGLFVRPDDPAALANAIARFLDDPAWASRVAARARADAEKRFTIKRYRGEITDLVASVAERTAG